MPTESPILSGLVRIYPICKRLLLQSPWDGELTGTQRLVLLTSAVSGAMTMTQLSEAIVCSKEQATRAVAPLVQQGYLQRHYDPKNRTRVFIQLTDQGAVRLQKQLESCAMPLRERFAALDHESRQQLLSAFAAVYDFLSHEDTKEVAHGNTI